MIRVFTSLLLVTVVLPGCQSRSHHKHDLKDRETTFSTTFTPPPTTEFWSTSTSDLRGIETRNTDDYSRSGSMPNTATTEEWYFGETTDYTEKDEMRSSTNTWWSSSGTWWTTSRFFSTSFWPSTESTTMLASTENPTTRFKVTPSPTAPPLVPICPAHTYACKNRQKCIGRGDVCDGKKDCPGGDDEEDCTNETNRDPWKGITMLTCADDEFQCLHDKRGHCLSNSRRCNGIKDCDNGEDEADCKELNCFTGYWKCDDGLRCIAQSEWCNNVRNCKDSSDEKHCVRSTCPMGEWRCKNGDCIPEHFKCDDFADCWDGSDESDKECIRT